MAFNNLTSPLTVAWTQARNPANNLVPPAKTASAPAPSAPAPVVASAPAPAPSAYSAPAADPYAQWGGQANFNQMAAGFNAQKSNIYGSANDAANALSGGYNQSIMDTIHALTLGQQGIDRRGVTNEASKIQGGRDVMSMVGRGIKSGGVYLANRNAGDSSAAEAIASAYGQIGQRQMSSIGNQYEQEASNIALDQQEQDYQVGRAPGRFHEQMMSNVNSIVNDARNKFAALDAAMAGASMPDRIAIDQEKETLRRQVLDILQKYDVQLTQGVGGIRAADQGTNVATANQQLSAGQADPNLFKYTTEVPTQFQGTGPFASELPIFTYKPKQRQ